MTKGVVIDLLQPHRLSSVRGPISLDPVRVLPWPALHELHVYPGFDDLDELLDQIEHRIRGLSGRQKRLASAALRNAWPADPKSPRQRQRMINTELEA
jgi:hypothetical protein